MASDYKWRSVGKLSLFGVSAYSTSQSTPGARHGVAVIGGDTVGKFLRPGTINITVLNKVQDGAGNVTTFNYSFSATASNINGQYDVNTGKWIPINPSLPYGGRITISSPGSISGEVVEKTNVFSWVGPLWNGTGAMPTNLCDPYKAEIESEGKLWSTVTVNYDLPTPPFGLEGWGVEISGTPSVVIETFMPTDVTQCNENILDENDNVIGTQSKFKQPPSTPKGGDAFLNIYVSAPSALLGTASIKPNPPNPDRRRGGDGDDEDEYPEENPPQGPSTIGGFPVLPGVDTGVPSTPDTIMVTVDPDPIIFEDTTVGQYRTKTFTIKNTGTAPINLTDIRSAIPTTPFGFVCDYSTPIPAGGTRTATAYFVPTEAIEYDEFCILYNEVGPMYEFQLQGTGVTEGGDPGEEEAIRSISLRGDTAANGDINFLEQTIDSTTVRQLFAVNTGTVPVVFNSYSLGGSSAFDTTGVSTGFNLQPGQEKAIPIAFTPVAAEEYIGTFSLVTNATTSPQTEIFNPATGTITANFDGKGVPEEVITRIMSFNVQNGGTLPDALAGGSATSEITATISSTGTGSILITSFQVEAPFTLDLANFGSVTPGTLGIYNLNTPLVLAPEQVSLPFIIKFTPPTATNYVDDVALFSNKTIGPNSFEVRGLGTFTEPEGPSGPVEPPTPGEEPGPEFDPGTTPSTGLDGIGSTCIPKECEVTYVYEYSANGEVVT